MIADLSTSIDKKFKRQETELNKALGKKFDEKLLPLTKKVATLEVKVTEIERKISDDADALSRVNNLQLSGLPYREGENLRTIFDKLSSLLGFSESPEAKLFRFNGDDDNKRPVSIVFPTEYHKLQYIQRYYGKAMELTRSKFPGFTNDNHRLYLQHDFTSAQYKLNRAAMAYVKEKLVLKTRVNSGNKISVQFTSHEKFVVFSSADSLKEEVERRQKRAAN